MKTLELKLKKDVLIVDLPQKVQNFKEVTITNNVLFADGKGNRTCLFIKFRDKLDDESINEYLEKGFKRIVLDYIEGDYEFICKGSELTEEIASELVEDGSYFKTFKNYTTNDNHKRNQLKFAKDSFISAVESKGFYWGQNPINHKNGYKSSSETYKQWQEAEEKTFKNPLIFVKKVIF